MSQVIATASDMLRVASLEELQRKGVIVAHGADRPVAVYWHDGKVFALDNRCPHLGFPLHRGSVKDGILTCHWHEARFDLCSGCTFDLFADDTPAFHSEVRDGAVYISRRPRHVPTAADYLRRLETGMQQNISLIQGKSLIGLLHGGADVGAVVGTAAAFGVRNRDGWASGMTVLTCMANLAPSLSEETAYFALLLGTSRVATDCSGQAPHRQRYPLDDAEISLDTLKRWLRYWTLVRHRDGGERTLLTAISMGATPGELTELLVTAATDRFYSGGGHVLDFMNKAFELLDLIGWEHAAEVLPAIVPQLVAARGGEEDNAWRHPIDLLPLMKDVEAQLPVWLKAGQGKRWDEPVALANAILGEDPHAIIAALRDAVRAGAQPTQLSKALAYAAALRILRFGSANELPDWITALHTFSHCNGLHQCLKRRATPELLRGVFHGAMSVYLDRFLNVPPARMPDRLGEQPTDAAALRERLLELLDGRHQINDAARVVARYLEQKHDIAALVDTLVMGAAREDIDFHAIQMVEAGVAQAREWQGTEQAEHILIAVARFLAAHCPTQRRLLQTATIALRLHRGEKIYEEE